jgi:Mitochondrial import 2
MTLDPGVQHLSVDGSDYSTPSESVWSSGGDESEDWRNRYLRAAMENSSGGDLDFTGDELDSFDELDAAQQEWDESIHQLQMLFALTLIPVAGKFLGRRFAHYCKYHTRNRCIQALV